MTIEKAMKTSGRAAFTAGVTGGGSVGAVWAHEPRAFADADDYYTNSLWRPRVVNTETWTSTPTDETLSSEGWFGDTFVVDGAPHFSVLGAGGGALVRYANGGVTTRITHSAGWLQAVQRVR